MNVVGSLKKWRIADGTKWDGAQFPLRPKLDIGDVSDTGHHSYHHSHIGTDRSFAELEL
jgi:hypothetical protein